ncbi:hypothetical protein BDV39DRAFT_116780 [Aspergillus sergii]|uniref:Uncharacterized protein n=1 Tax=Aspergillus sergii TaxID=1034303 RepID=A0A5N6WVF1_9EURO|nr:hypothetical protein BDV39DRAFT_116780 [Aspergillus sergii]
MTEVSSTRLYLGNLPRNGMQLFINPFSERFPSILQPDWNVAHLVCCAPSTRMLRWIAKALLSFGPDAQQGNCAAPAVFSQRSPGACLIKGTGTYSLSFLLLKALPTPDSYWQPIVPSG